MAMAVLLLDDGELDDVQEMLERIKAPFGRVRGGAIVPNTPPPTSLLISTPRRIDMVRETRANEVEGEGPVRIVVVDGDSTTLRAKLREIGFDYLVRRPVHAEALRLLLLHCLYTGEERRREPRVPMGSAVSFRTGLLPRRAILVDLSSGGCRLHSSYRIEADKSVRIQIPKAAGTTETLTLGGRVVRVEWDDRLGEEGLYCAAIAFENMENEARRELEWILEERAKGPATMEDPGLDDLEVDDEQDSPEAASIFDEIGEDASIEIDVRMQPEGKLGSETASDDASVETPDESTEASPDHEERRGSPRGSYDRKVPAFGSQALRMLFGRDLSAGGMRIERYPELEIGDRLHLAIYGDPREEPFLVWATVHRDDGEDGMALSFDEPHPMVAEQLEKVVASLPSVESLHDDEAAAMGSVVSRILED